MLTSLSQSKCMQPLIHVPPPLQVRYRFLDLNMTTLSFAGSGHAHDIE